MSDAQRTDPGRSEGTPAVAAGGPVEGTAAQFVRDAFGFVREPPPNDVKRLARVAVLRGDLAP
ncbi:hypothetical protein GRX01_13775 [Halobaculum sp. WSA2]|uniref:Uncharacterized protein n=1 Tax=Halobaculum saliterrae TaxID=2073113 RepID=A0A6B0T0V3_9EURY|nr:hypothetical protein [Halobaculum saliterrae]MXR42403.1 hypothetical protein [Halobaculum saliterrae]